MKLRHVTHVPEIEAIAATLRIAQPHEELRPRPAGLELEVLDGVDKGVHRVRGNTLSVGRGELCDITMHDTSISQFHFRLLLGTEEVVLEDLGSSNGIWIGRARVERAALLPGARFRAGSVRMQLRAITTAPSAVLRDDHFHGVRARSEAMRSLFSLLARIAPTPLSVLFCGETGVGKGFLGRALHRASGRTGPFVTIDCTALPHQMADGLLFGHVKGAFTGAVSDRQSPFEEAQGGTVFLDEIGELPLELQPKLLRALDERVVQRVGDHATRPIDVRIVAATNRDVLQEISEGRFRSDLYHRIAGSVVRIPALRNRREDVPFLASLFLEDLCPVDRALVLGNETREALMQRDWPGNVRELRQTIERSVYLSEGPELALASTIHEPHELETPVLPRKGQESADHDIEPKPGPLRPLVDDFKRDYCRRLLARSPNLAIAAREAGFSVRGFQMMLGKLGLSAQELLGHQ